MVQTSLTLRVTTSTLLTLRVTTSTLLTLRVAIEGRDAIEGLLTLRVTIGVAKLIALEDLAFAA